MNDLLLSLAMAALGQLGGYGAAPGMGGGPGIGYGPGMGPGIRIGIRGGGSPMGVPLPYGGFPGQGTRIVPGYPTTAMPQRPSSAGPAPSSEAEAFGLAPYR